MLVLESRFSSFLKGQYSKITFRTPLYLGGAPRTYWLARATGTDRGFQGCVQSLRVNGERVDMQPWPLGRALGGADVGKWVPSGATVCAFLVWAGVGVSCSQSVFASSGDLHLKMTKRTPHGPL